MTLLVPLIPDPTPTPAGFHFAQIIGTGIDDDPYRPVVASIRDVNYAATIQTNPDGTPTRAWTLVWTSPSTAAFDRGELPNEPLPKVDRAEPLGLNGTQRTALRASILAKFGLDLPIAAQTTLGEIVAAVDQHLAP